jgi:MFS family permease
MVGACVVLAYLNRSQIDSAGAASMIVPAVTSAALGAIVASRRPENPIGWLLLASAGFLSLGALSLQLALHGLLDGGAPEGWVRWSGWVSNWITTPGFAIGALIFLLFPDGRPPSPRWRWLIWAAAAFGVIYTVGTALDPAPVELSNKFPELSNPVGVSALQGFQASPIFFGALLLLGCSVVSLVLRFRRSRGLERQQLKWFSFAAAVTIGGLVIAVPLYGASPLISNVLWYSALTLGLGVAIPGAATIAILKYRLYDIDRIINKTLVYGALTVVLGGLYAGLALGLGSLAGRSNSVVIAGSTLVVAALFRPLRRRIQAFIDRRFYRRRYDAARTLEGFGGVMRQDVHLDALRRHLVGVVQDTMQPAGVSLWLRRPDRGD